MENRECKRGRPVIALQPGGLRRRIRQGELILGQMVLELFTPGIGPMLDACGLDFVLFDMEHGRCDIMLLAEMVASCRGSKIVPMARVPDPAYAPLSRVLDVGALGVMVPRVENRLQAQEIVSQLRYAPAGRRGVAVGIAHDLYRPGDQDSFARINEEICVILLLETAIAFENLDEILSVPGVDVAWMGHYDLTVSMGIPAQFDHPRFLAAMDALVAVCGRYGVAPGFLPPTPESAAHWISKGFRVISLGSDGGVFIDGVRRFRAHLDTSSSTPGTGKEGKA
jgi:2-keto-3-deoxy-L-rhamnonate aldolase RhmA